MIQILHSFVISFLNNSFRMFTHKGFYWSKPTWVTQKNARKPWEKWEKNIKNKKISMCLKKKKKKKQSKNLRHGGGLVMQ